MSLEYLKKASGEQGDSGSDVSQTVREMLDTIEAGGDQAALDYAAKFDRYDGDIRLDAEGLAVWYRRREQ